MPVPRTTELRDLADAAFEPEDPDADHVLAGSGLVPLKGALAQATHHAFLALQLQAQVLPGIAAAVNGAGGGSCTGRGGLIPAPLGSPPAPALQELVADALADHDIAGTTSDRLTELLSEILAAGLARFVETAEADLAGVQVLGFVTTLPGKVVLGSLEAPGEAQKHLDDFGIAEPEHYRPLLASALDTYLAEALTLLAERLVVAPLVPCVATATAGPGRLL